MEVSGNLAGDPSQPTGVSVSNPLSKLSSTLHVSVMQLSPDGLVISLLHGPLGVPSCFPFLETDSQSGAVATAYLGDSVTLRAYISEGLGVEFCWWFIHEEREERDKAEEERKGLKKACLPDSDCLSSIVLSAGQDISVDVELFTTIKQPLLLNLTLNTDCEHNCGHSNDHSSKVQLPSTSPPSLPPPHHCGAVSPLSFLALALNIPSVVTMKQPTSVLFTVTAGSNVTMALLVNATLLYRNSSYTTGAEAAAVLLFHHSGTVEVVLRAENLVSSRNRSVSVGVMSNRELSPPVSSNEIWPSPTRQSPVHTVRIYAAKQAYPTNTDITFLAVADEPDPLEFLWYFGDSRPVRTPARMITKRYRTPGRYSVVVVVSSGLASLTSEPFPMVVQRAVQINRLVHRASVLQNQTVPVSCRVNVGTDLTYLWNFGDGTSRLGRNTEQHVFHRVGEFRVEVIVSNLVSSASLSSQIFVVDRPCQPPPVKNMGPLKVQVRRYEAIRLGVTYETEVDCDVSGGLHYTWMLYDSAGQAFPLPLIDTHRQSIILPSHLLHYDTYTAIARVQIVSSVVYSNYTVRLEVVPSPPVAFIQGGTNVFINNRNTTMVTLDGLRSYDPDFPMNPISYSWRCKPISSIISSCFNQYVPTSSSVFTFPASFLKHNFDQFQFTLTVHSGERSASSETFLTVTPNLIRKVSVYCLQCQGEQVNWDQAFSVSAVCESCDVSPEDIHYTWSLYLVNASSKPIIEVPFCHTVDLSAPSTITGGPAAPHLTPGTSTLHPPAIREEQYHHRLGEFDPPEPLYPFSEHAPVVLDTGSILYSAPFGQSDIISEFPIDSDSSADSDYTFPVLESADMGGRLEFQCMSLPCVKVESFTDSDYDVPFLGVEEGDPGISEGRPIGMYVGGESSGPGGDSGFDPEPGEDKGSNLVDSSPSLVFQEQTLLDLPRDPVERGLFESYTYTGISSPLLSFRPFSLRPGSRYMLEVTAKSHNTFLGRTQLFLATNPAPRGMNCQVQPSNGVEIHTHFSIFCTRERKDLLYKYSFSVGDSTRRTLYQGRDFQYYFNLPSGDPSDDYKVYIHTHIRSSRFGTATKPCPVTVRVQPSFLRNASSCFDHDLELSESGLRNLSALVRFGNSVEIRNYISLLSSVLNRLSMDISANTHAQTHTRNVLISTVCELEISDQASMTDNIYILKDLLQVTHQVTLVSAKQVTAHIQAISERFESGVPVLYCLDLITVHTLLTLLSYSLQATATADDLTPETANTDDIMTDYLLSGSSKGENIKQEKVFSTEQVLQLVTNSLQIAADLMLKYILLSKTQQHSVSTSVMALHAAYRNQTSTIISSGSATIYMPESLNQLLFVPNGGGTEDGQRRPCVLSLLSEFTQSPYSWASAPAQLSGPVVDLSFYKCSTRRKIPVQSLLQPINIEFRQTPRNKSSVREYILLRSQVNYHSLNITQQHLQQAIQLSVVFAQLPNKKFPIMLLFRMLERPTPSLYHLHRIHQWENNTTRLTLPPSYLSAVGVGYLALLNADYGKPPRHKYLSSQVSYSITLESSLCLSWDAHQGAWTPRGCTTQQSETTTAVNCSCNKLRPLTVVQHQIQSSHEAADLDQFLSLVSDLTVVGVLVLCVCLYTLGLAVCKRADVVSEKSQRVHYLSDNSPSDPYLYAVTIHTGLCSAANMSAKVYIVLYGEDGVSQTRELQVPECTLFRRNSKDTFILSATDSLGPVWGVHLWHDNSGPSPSWYLKQVEVCEVNRGHVMGRSWLFLGQCWLAVSESDGRVERRLRVCTQGIGFSKLLYLKLSDYLADFHLWVSVYSRPSPSSFTHTQRLSMCLLLLLGYTCVNTLLISQMEDQLAFELGLIDVSAVSVRTGVLSVLAVLPVATMISFLFRLHEVMLMGSGVKLERKPENYSFEDSMLVNNIVLESRLSWSGLQQWAQEAWRKKYQGPDLVSVSTGDLVNKDKNEEPVIQKDLVIRKEDALEIQGSRELALQDLNTEGNSVDPVPQGKERDLVSQSSKNHATQKDMSTNRKDWNLVMQKDLVNSRRDGDLVVKANHRNLVTTDSRNPVHQKELINHCNKDLQTDGDLVIQKEKDPVAQVKGSSDSGFEDGKLLLSGRRVRPRPHWCLHLAWTLCLLLSLCCLLLSALLGIRFSSSKVLLWIHSLFFSLISCIFLIQPAMILIVAVIVSLWYRKRTDFYSFCGIIGFEIEKLWSQHGGYQPEELQLRPSAFPQEGCSYLEKLLVARQRARYLRLVRPPTPAELKKTHEKKRKETLIHKTLRELSLYVSMLVLLLCLTYDGSFSDHYHLNKAVRIQFTRDHHNPFLSIQNHDDWWKWTQTGLLNVLYKTSSATTKALQGVEFISAQVSGGMAGRVTECPPLFWFGSRAFFYPGSALMFPTAAAQQMCGHLGCYSGPSAMVGLGLTRSEAASKLKFLHSGGWLGRRTVALKVQITLYSPAPNLFSSVTLLTEQSPTGVLLTSANVQSVRIYHTPSVWGYGVMVCQLLFLLLSLLQLCRQAYTVGQQGLMGYWRTPCNWLEVSLLTVILVYYVYYICHSIITLEVVDLLQRHDYRGHVDVSLLAVREQQIRTLRGLMLFLLSVRCVSVLRVNRTVATSATVFTQSLSSLFWPMVSGLLLLVALSCVGNLLFIQRSRAFSSLPRSLQTLLSHCWGLRAVRGLFLSGCGAPSSFSDIVYHGALCLTSSVVWTAVVMCVVSSLVRVAKRAHCRRDVFTLAETATYIRHRVSVFTGQHRPRWTENQTERRNYYLEEFESLVDELLFRLNALSNSLHHTLPPKAHRYREDSPSICPTQKPCSVDTQCFVKTHMTEETIANDHTDISDLCLPSHGEHSPASHLLSQATRYTCTEVVVEVLVHEKPGSGELGKQ
ncbi:LOW QUALITY PROTEIN: polycystin-1-like protein 1 [Centroberyx affinis]|uniref:LOW QUALITY PROTEIN: polycystin-1-like protein 1 n=1 Tax=Centroberyx affinis TaxID=166261 RepID=UPI003A5C5978